MYCIHHNLVVWREETSYIVNTVIILQKLGLMGRRWCKPVNYRWMVNNWFLEVRKILICTLYQFLCYKYSHHDWFQAANISLINSQNSWKFNQSGPSSQCKPVPELPVQVKDTAQRCGSRWDHRRKPDWPYPRKPHNTSIRYWHLSWALKEGGDLSLSQLMDDPLQLHFIYCLWRLPHRNSRDDHTDHKD